MTVHSLDRESENTKLDHVRRRAGAIPNTVFNNIGHVITEELLHEAFTSIAGSKAIGVDNITKVLYEKDLHINIKQLMKKVRNGSYKPQPARIVHIPKEDGSTRPLAISCFEDKIVQWAIGKILEAVYEPVFLPCSYGFRPKRNCHEALRHLVQGAYLCKDGALIEIDIRKCFNRIPHDHLLSFLQAKITDKRFLRLVKKLITAPIIDDGKTSASHLGCPQGSIVSPILCNIFLHHVVDEWFHIVSKTHLKGKSELIRYADDMVFIFEKMEDAVRIFRVLGKRLNKYGLEIHEAKSALLPFGKKTAARMALDGQRIPIFTFLGFTCYWGKARKGFFRLKLKSRSDRYTGTLKRLRAFLRENRTTEDEKGLLQSVIRRMKGWINYHAVSDNQRRVLGFILDVRRILLQWFNRRGRRNAMNWHKLDLKLKQAKYPSTFKVISMIK